MTEVSGAGRARRRPIGAEVDASGTSFRIWAPNRREVSIVVENGSEHRLTPDGHGYAVGHVPGVGDGALYRVRLDDDSRLYPDPASRFQPQGPHGPSRVVDPARFRWTDSGWQGVGIAGRVISEIHIGTFTPAGTWAAAAEKLPHLKDVGINTVEMMPVADFPGRFGWGYDGVDLFAPTQLYGEPDDLKAFIDRAHALGIAVILDVVYNHLGPDGNFLSSFSPAYFTDRHHTDWGAAINFDGPDNLPVREFFVENAAYWIGEYHFDGLRLDATQSIFDDGPRHVIAELTAAARAAAGSRQIIVVGENEPQEARLARSPERGGYGLDALWNDDLHHSAVVALTGRSEAYYADYAGTPQEFIAAAKYGYLFQGQHSGQQGKRRGTPVFDLPPAAFVTFLQNHDQIANSGSGLPIHRLSSAAAARAMTGFQLLLPGTPMLFQGQEFWSDRPFFYFCDHEAPLAGQVRAGRTSFLRQFATIDGDPEVRDGIADPGAPETFQRSKLAWSECDRNGPILALHRDLLRIRRTDPTFGRQQRSGLDGAVLGANAWALRIFGPDGDDRLVLTNLGRDLALASIPDPLLAPPAGRVWSLLWSSEHVAYGGSGTPVIDGPHGWRLPGAATVVLQPSFSEEGR